MEIKIYINELSQRLRHSSIEYTLIWCDANRVEVHILESTGQKFIFSFQFEAAIIKIRFLALKKTYGKSWEEQWQNAMKEYMRKEIKLIILN